MKSLVDMTYYLIDLTLLLFLADREASYVGWRDSYNIIIWLDIVTTLMVKFDWLFESCITSVRWRLPSFIVSLFVSPLFS